MVYGNQPHIKLGTKSKLTRKWTGPWKIVRRLSDVLYEIKHSRNSKPAVIHLDNLKLYRDRNIQTLPVDNQGRDSEHHVTKEAEASDRHQRTIETHNNVKGIPGMSRYPGCWTSNKSRRHTLD